MPDTLLHNSGSKFVFKIKWGVFQASLLSADLEHPTERSDPWVLFLINASVVKQH